jgi:hypothetical protein
MGLVRQGISNSRPFPSRIREGNGAAREWVVKGLEIAGFIPPLLNPADSP